MTARPTASIREQLAARASVAAACGAVALLPLSAGTKFLLGFESITWIEPALLLGLVSTVLYIIALRDLPSRSPAGGSNRGDARSICTLGDRQCNYPRGSSTESNRRGARCFDREFYSRLKAENTTLGWRPSDLPGKVPLISRTSELDSVASGQYALRLHATPAPQGQTLLAIHTDTFTVSPGETYYLSASVGSQSIWTRLGVLVNGTWVDSEVEPVRAGTITTTSNRVQPLRAASSLLRGMSSRSPWEHAFVAECVRTSPSMR